MTPTLSMFGGTRSSVTNFCPPVINFTAYSTAGMAGTSFKHEHFAAINADPTYRGFFEVHAENYMGDGGFPHRALTRIRSDNPVSLHGVCLSIGGVQPIDLAHLARFKALVERYEPVLVSEHLAWSTHDTVYYNDLLPLPYTEATLARVVEHIDLVQTTIRRPILLENPSTYFAFSHSTMREADFLHAIARRTGCKLLLDINNVFVSALNHGSNARAYLNDFPLEEVEEIHLAGHVEQLDRAGEKVLIDSHDRNVADPVWALYEAVVSARGSVPTLIEWDSALPSWPELKAEAARAQRILNRHSIRERSKETVNAID